MKRSGHLVFVALLAMALAPAAEAKRPSCYRPGWTTVMQNGKVRVFYRDTEGDLSARNYYGCLRRTGRRMFLTEGYTTQTDSSGPYFFRLRGTLVAWAEDSCSLEDCDPYAATVDVRTRKTIRSFEDGRPLVNSTISDLELAPSGSLGLMQADGGGPRGEPLTYNVIGVTAGGRTVFDAGEDIDPSSLALGGRWLYWTRAEQPHSSRLP